MLKSVRAEIREKFVDLGVDVDDRLDRWLAARDPVAFRNVELEIAALGRSAADAMTASVLRGILADPALQAEAALAAHQGGKLRHGGTREIGVTLLGGTEVRVAVEYATPNHRGRPRRGRPRRVGQRGKGGAGVYPMLAVLGIWYGVTPALGGEVCRQVADSDSVRAGRAALDRRGIDLGHKRTLRVVNKYGGRAVEQRDAWLQRMRDNKPVRGVLRGKRVVIGTDGGRLRERCADGRGRRRANGHRRYDAPWREPKLLTIYVIGDDGRIETSFQPVYDGTLGDADDIFDMLAGYLKALGAHEARQLILVGDGAKWIWDRAPKLAERLGLDLLKQVKQVIDWCHAVGVLHEIAEVPTISDKWSEKDKLAWLTRAKNRLHAGKTDELVALVDSLAVGRRAKAVKEHREYFVRNAERMQYAAFETAGIPTGSGAIESAVRRIVNMRMKSNGMFWLEVNAEGMLLLRSYLKSGYLDSLIDWTLMGAAPWWQPEALALATPLDPRRDD